MRGKNTLKIEVQEISRYGVWIHLEGKEYFLKFEQYPWFRKAARSEIHNVELLHARHLYWPDLDVDLEVSSLECPENYPLVYQGRSSRSSKPCVNEKKQTKYGKKK